MVDRLKFAKSPYDTQNSLLEDWTLVTGCCYYDRATKDVDSTNSMFTAWKPTDRIYVWTELFLTGNWSIAFLLYRVRWPHPTQARKAGRRPTRRAQARRPKPPRLGLVLATFDYKSLSETSSSPPRWSHLELDSMPMAYANVVLISDYHWNSTGRG